MKLVYDRGTLLLIDAPQGFRPPPYFRFDRRVGAYRALAKDYARALNDLPDVEDHVLREPECSWGDVEIPLRPYQREALEAWLEAGCRGVVVLPTGAGKTRVALAAMAELRCPTLVVAPTLELVDQWVARVKRLLGVEPGEFTGESKEISCVTVSTYSSAYLNAETLGNRFRLVVFDEVHHLPSPAYRQIAELCAAPYRLGLTATPEREDELHGLLPELVGPVVYRLSPGDLRGAYLADFDVVRVAVDMTEEERRKYETLVRRYKRYLSRAGIVLRSVRDFEKLVMRSGLDPEAREALLAWMEARRIAFSSRAKLERLREILEKHRGDRIIIFTESNELVREISKRFLVPEITYKTPKEERRTIMEMFRRGEVRAIVTSHVLEEGVDVPEANVAIVISGTGSRREFVQRLGRILRPREGKRAILYEMVTRGTSEIHVSRRRRRGLRKPRQSKK
mgnify:FL=1